jgi:hypothetical protein
MTRDRGERLCPDTETAQGPFPHLDERLVDHAGRHDNPAAHAGADQAGLDREAEAR